MPHTSPVPRSFSPTATTARQRLAIELFASGLKVPEIGRQLGGISDSGVRKLIRRALDRQAAALRADGAHERAAAQFWQWHQQLMTAWMPRALALDDKAADFVAKLLALYVDVKGLRHRGVEAGSAAKGALPAGAESDLDSGGGRPGVDQVAEALRLLALVAERQLPPADVIDGDVVSPKGGVLPDSEDRSYPDPRAEISTDQ